MAKPYGNGSKQSASYGRSFTLDGDTFTPSNGVKSTWSFTDANDWLYIGNGNGATSSDYTSATLNSYDGKGGDDQLIFTKSADLLINDAYFTNFDSFSVLKLANSGTNSLSLGVEANQTGINDVSGGSGNDTITLDGTAYAETSVKISGGDGNDVITSAGGNDTLAGGSGADTIDGGDGADMIDGGDGADALTGGAGADVFVYTNRSDSGADAMDTVQDFSTTEDLLDFGAVALAADSTTAVVVVADGYTWDVAAAISNGVVQLSGLDASTVDTWAEALAVLNTAGLVQVAAEADNALVAIEAGGNTYVAVFDDSAADGTFVLETVVQLTGVTGLSSVNNIVVNQFVA